MITLITSLFNGEKYIDFYLENIVLCKDYDKCEHLIFNIVSSNNNYVFKILKKYSSKHNNIKVIDIEKDIGLYNIWNKGIKISKFDLISNSNIDDYITKDFLVEHYNYMIKNPEINLVCSTPKISYNIIKNTNIDTIKDEWFRQKNIKYVNNDINYVYKNTTEIENKINLYTGIVNEELCHEKYPSNIIDYLKIKKKFMEYNYHKNIWLTYDYFDLYDMIRIENNKWTTFNIPHSCLVWRKKLHTKYGYFNEKKFRKNSDYEFWLRCLSNKEIFGHINKNLYIYYYNKNSHNNIINKTDTKIKLYILKKYFNI